MASFVYKKYLEAPAPIIEEVYAGEADYVVVESRPEWAVAMPSPEPGGFPVPGFHYFRIGIDPHVANNLTPGIHSGVIVLRAFINNQEAAVGNISVSLEVIDNVVLRLSKTSFSFSHTQGEQAPGAQLLDITTENTWSIVADEPWLLFSENNGSGSQTIELSVEVAGLSIGFYESNFLVDDGDRTKSGKVTLSISGEQGPDDYLHISSKTITFSEPLETPSSRSASFVIESSLPANLVASEAWISLSEETLPPGEERIIVSTTGTENLEEGTYFGNIRIETGLSTQIIDVVLRVVDPQVSGIESGELYFAGDRKKLIISSVIPNAEVLLDVTARYAGNLKRNQRRVPYFQNTAESILGTESDILIRPHLFPMDFQGVYQPYQPLSLDVSVYDKKMNDNVLTQRQVFTNLRFIPGRTSARLTGMPSTVTVPKDGLISFSFLTSPTIQSIDVTGAAEMSIPVNSSAGSVHTAVIRLADLELQPKDRLEVEYGPHVQEIIIKPADFETSQLIWLNEWGCPEVINLTGALEVTTEEDSTTVTVARDGKEISAIIEAKQPDSFKVNTGGIYSQEEVQWLSDILHRRKMWLQIDGNRYEVVRTFRNITHKKSREFLWQFDLTFDSAER